MATPDDFLQLFETFARVGGLWPNVHPSGFNVSTMTVLATSARPVSLGAIARVAEPDFPGVLLEPGRLHPSGRPTRLQVRWVKKRQRKAGEFGNQVTLAYNDWTDRSIKVFSHGGLHLTGCKNLGEFHRLSNVVGGLMLAVGAVDHRMLFGPPRVVMLNFNFALNCELNLKAVAKAALRDLGLVATHETESHPALMLDLRLLPAQKTTVMVFRSGRVLVSSSSQLHGVMAAYRMVCQLVSDNLVEVRARVILRSHTKRKATLFVDGYPTGQALPCFGEVARRRVAS